MYGHVYMQLRPPQIVKNAQSFPSHPPLHDCLLLHCKEPNTFLII
jgi:hypothetical protein